MRKVKVLQEGLGPTNTLKLKDFSLFEEKMTKIKHLTALKQEMDKSLLLTTVEELGYQGKKITAKKLKKIYKKTLIKMIEEIEGRT